MTMKTWQRGFVFLLVLTVVFSHAQTAFSGSEIPCGTGYLKTFDMGFYDVSTRDWYYFEVTACVQMHFMSGTGMAYVGWDKVPYFNADEYQWENWWRHSLTLAFESPHQCYTVPSTSIGHVIREIAFSDVIDAAGLASEAAALSDAQANQILSIFPDDHKISPQYRKKVALATKYGIARGHDTGYLKPEDRLTRAQAAAIIVRSGFMRLSSDKRTATQGENIKIGAKVWNYGSVRYSKIQVKNASGTVIKEWNWNDSAPPSEITWDGKTQAGALAPTGEYLIVGEITVSNGYSSPTFPTVPVPLTIIAGDTAGPTGGISINGGAPATFKRNVTLSLWASDSSGVSSMRLRNAGGSWTEWLSYTTSYPWTLPEPSKAVKTVEVQYQDTKGNISGTYSDSIRWDYAYAEIDPYQVAKDDPQHNLKITLYCDTTQWSGASANLSVVNGPSSVGLNYVNWDRFYGYATIGQLEYGEYQIPVTVWNGYESAILYAPLKVGDKTVHLID